MDGPTGARPKEGPALCMSGVNLDCRNIQFATSVEVSKSWFLTQSAKVIATFEVLLETHGCSVGSRSNLVLAANGFFHDLPESTCTVYFSQVVSSTDLCKECL